ncbi:MAG: hypothetical protein FD155_1465 [Bacteroidetes bacterium]|nr:MAG: hypothetical protein FD155_1465 [Bacteroidota bacterium]
MNRFKAGDKVRFLNDVGGGIVVKVVDSKMALVAIEEGFEIPVLMSELIPTEEQSRQTSAQEVLQKEIIAKVQETEKQAEASRRESLRRFAKDPEPEGFYLAFVPHEQQWILTGLLDVIFVNNSPLSMYFSLNLIDNGRFTNVDHGLLKPYSKVLIETISREDINNWSKGYIQGILIPETSQNVFLPLHAAFDIKPNRFYKEGSYVMAQILGDKAIMVNLQQLTALKADNASAQPSKFDQTPQEFQPQIVREKALIDKHRKNPGEAIVDLHIGELLDNIAGLSSHDMYKIQLDYFHKTLNSAILNEYDKVTYIHGVGNGVLKNAIIKALENFEGVNNRMASMSKFGVGAIDVMIKEI